MSTQKVKIFLGVLFVMIFMVGGIFIYSQNQNKLNVLPNKDNFDPNQYESVESYLKTISVEGIDLLKEPFIMKNKGAVVVLDSKYFSEYNNNREKLNSILNQIHESYIQKRIEKTQKGSGESGFQFFTEEQLPEAAKLNNEILSPYDGKSFIQLKSELIKKQNKTSDDYNSLALLSSFEGNYKESDSYRKASCVKNKNFCIKNIKLNIQGVVLDDKNKPIKNAKIELLNDTKNIVYSDENGKYIFSLNVYPSDRIRLRASADNFSDGFVAFTTYFMGNLEQKEEGNFILQSPNKVLTLDSSHLKNEYYEFSTDYTSYRIAKNSIVNKKGEQYTGSIKVYLYEFNKSTNMDNYMNNDTFDSVYGYVGNIMKTFGMPYIQIFNPTTKEELFIKKENPAKIMVQVQNMKELYENHDKIYEALTTEDMQKLVDASNNACHNKSDCYPIDREWLIQNQFLRWPAWWVLNRTKGTWENIGTKIIDTKGQFETIFYSVE